MIYTILVLALGFVLMLIPTARSEEPFEEALRSAQQLPSLLKSVEMNSAKYGTGFGHDILLIDGDKFYHGYVNNLNERHTKSFGFDGTTYWDRDLNPQRPAMAGYGTKSFFPVGLGGSTPLIAPYLWFWGDLKKISWSDLHSPKAWSEVTSMLKYESTRSIRDQTCDVFSIEYPDQNKSYRIAFSRELGGFPIQVERSANDKHFGTLDVIKTHKDRSGAILAIELQSTLAGESPKLESAVDVSTLRINEPIDPAKFSFDPVGIEIVVDVDAREKAKQERSNNKKD